VGPARGHRTRRGPPAGLAARVQVPQRGLPAPPEAVAFPIDYSGFSLTFFYLPIGSSGFHGRRGATSQKRPNVFLWARFYVVYFHFDCFPGFFLSPTNFLLQRLCWYPRDFRTTRLVTSIVRLTSIALGGGGRGRKSIDAIRKPSLRRTPRGGVQLSQQLRANHQPFFQPQDPPLLIERPIFSRLYIGGGLKGKHEGRATSRK